MANQAAVETVLKVTERDTTLNPRQLRTAGYIPATLYGKNTPSVQIQVRTHELTQLIMHVGRHFEVSGFVSGKVQVSQLQVDAVSQRPISLELLLK